MTGFESTYQPAHDCDVMETTEHDRRWRSDLDLVSASRVRLVRYPLRWHRIEPEPGRFEWRHADIVMDALRERGFLPYVDLLHHTSYPRWLGDLSSPRFPAAFTRFAETAAERYPWVPGYTVCNEPLTTLLMCSFVGVWPPHHRGMASFIELARRVVPTINDVARRLGRLLPAADHLHVEVCEHHTYTDDGGRNDAELANDRRFFVTDLVAGHAISPDRPFAQAVIAAGGADLSSVEPGRIDVLGLDYYAHNQWEWHGPDRGTTAPTAPVKLADLIGEYAARYRLPVAVSETNIRGYASDRATWLKYTLEQCELARAAGVDLRWHCWFPFIDSADWSSLLVERGGAIDPVGVFWLDHSLDRRQSSMATAFSLATGGAPAAALPAYRLQPPVSQWLAGWAPQMSHWQWSDPLPCEIAPVGHHPHPNPSSRSLDAA
jgi:beta-glucosidase/6-phospho-beta-glucosidase/beta-galactosidase